MNKERLMKVVLSPIISEKSTRIGDSNRQYVFKVVPSATKPEIRSAIELLFEVKVAGVQVTNMRGKVKAYRQSVGRRSNWKKAYITLQEGHEIDFAGVVG